MSPSQRRKGSRGVRLPRPVAIDIRAPADRLSRLGRGHSGTQKGPRRDPQASDERWVHLGSPAKALQALCRTRTGDPFLTIEVRGRHRVPERPGSPMNAGHFGHDGTSRTLWRDPEGTQWRSRRRPVPHARSSPDCRTGSLPRSKTAIEADRAQAIPAGGDRRPSRASSRIARARRRGSPRRGSRRGLAPGHPVR